MIFLFFKLNQVLGDYSHCLATTHNKRERERERNTSFKTNFNRMLFKECRRNSYHTNQKIKKKPHRSLNMEFEYIIYFLI